MLIQIKEKFFKSLPILSAVFLVAVGAIVIWTQIPWEDVSAADDSITINWVHFDLSVDHDGNNIANIGDTVRVIVNLTNTDQGPVTGTRARVDLTAYGGAADQYVTYWTQTPGVGQDEWEFTGEYVVSDAGGSGIDVGPDNAASAVTVTAYDNDEDNGVGNPTPTMVSNNLGDGVTDMMAAFGVDTIAPTITSTNVNIDGSACTGASTACIIGDTVTFTWDNSVVTGDNNSDTIAGVSANLQNYSGSLSQTLYDDATNGDVGAGDEIYTYQLVMAEDDDEGRYSINCTVQDDAGNTASSNSNNSHGVDNVRPTVVNAYTSDSNTNGYAETVDLEFSEPIQDATISLPRVEADDDDVNDDDSNETAFTAGDTEVTYPSYDADADDEYYSLSTTDGIFDTTALYVHFSGVSTRDIEGNSITAGDGLGTENDMAQPVIMQVTPAENATGVGLGQDIILVFSEPMSTRFRAGTEFNVSPDPGNWNVTWSNNDQTVTASHDNFAGSNSIITVETVELIITAAAGTYTQLLTTGPQDGDWSFTTESSGDGGGGFFGAPTPDSSSSSSTTTEETVSLPETTTARNTSVSDDGTVIVYTEEQTTQGNQPYLNMNAVITPSSDIIDDQTIMLDTSGWRDINSCSVTLPAGVLQAWVNQYGYEDITVEIISKEATDEQKTDDARQGKYLIGFDVFNIQIKINNEIISEMPDSIILSFDVSGLSDPASVSVAHFNENSRMWEELGGLLEEKMLTLEVGYLSDFGLITDLQVQAEPAQPQLNLWAQHWEEIKNEAQIVYDSGTDLSLIIEHNNAMHDVEAQIFGMENYTNDLIRDFAELTINNGYAINNFIVYGTQTTADLGMGERAGVVSSYKYAYGNLPVTVDQWRDCIAIANGRWPNVRNQDAEDRAAREFRTIYGRDVQDSNLQDVSAQMIIAYGLRPMQRNMESELAGLSTYYQIFNKEPQTAHDWDLLRAIIYSGAVK